MRVAFEIETGGALTPEESKEWLALLRDRLEELARPTRPDAVVAVVEPWCGGPGGRHDWAELGQLQIGGRPHPVVVCKRCSSRLVDL